ncbi:MAG: hypothetical protein LBP89_01430 [Helicobacteraceae bacterium]|jgi:hypothetical protein|nr:hypothetical protein [Helicobacteraceae bacterium]
MIDKVIFRLKNKAPNFKIFTASIRTDAQAAANSIGFDDKENSLKRVKIRNKWSKKYYDRYMARTFKPIEDSRIRDLAFVDISKR